MFETILVVAICVLLPLVPQAISLWLLNEQESNEPHYEYDYR